VALTAEHENPNRVQFNVSWYGLASVIREMVGPPIIEGSHPSKELKTQ